MQTPSAERSRLRERHTQQRRSMVEVKDHYMARALLGYVGNGNEQVLASEIARLRRRVAELEAELTELKDSRRADLDLELHRLADSATPALA